MLESGHLTEGGENYIRQRLQERGVSPQDIEAIASASREYSFWQILKDTLRGYPKPLE